MTAPMAAMPQMYKNEGDIPITIAAWLAYDDYDYVDDPNYVSATTLLKSTRQIILSERIEKTNSAPIVDINTRIASAIGSALHNSVEYVWKHHYVECLQKLGVPQGIIDRIVVNPTTVRPGDIPVYLEQRSTKKIEGYILGGKFDIVSNGVVEDIKTTQVYSFTSGNNHWKYRLQGSIYRWLNPEIITADYMRVNFIFHDWKAYEYRARKDKGYPPCKVYGHKIKLMSLPETESYIRTKLTEIEFNRSVPELDLPLCNSNELWQDAPKYKYYKNPKATGRSTKNFDTMAEATSRLIQDGSVGRIDTVWGKAKACMYCPAFQLCSQKDELIRTGFLPLN